MISLTLMSVRNILWPWPGIAGGAMKQLVSAFPRDMIWWPNAEKVIRMWSLQNCFSLLYFFTLPFILFFSSVQVTLPNFTVILLPVFDTSLLCLVKFFPLKSAAYCRLFVIFPCNFFSFSARPHQMLFHSRQTNVFNGFDLNQPANILPFYSFVVLIVVPVMVFDLRLLPFLLLLFSNWSIILYFYSQ